MAADRKEGQMKLHELDISKDLYRELRIDCSKCSGLCCTALFFSKTDGFPENKSAGKPCVNLQKDFRCSIHKDLINKNMKGCIGYDCFGAGQKVTQIIYGSTTWQTAPEKSKQIFEVFLTVFHLHQMLWFLIESKSLLPARALWEDVDKLIEKNRNVCGSSPETILEFDLEDYKNQVNGILKQVSTLVIMNFKNNDKVHKNYFGKSFCGRNMDGLDLSMNLLIAADFSKCSFSGTDFLGADTRDANFDNADLREAVFLTQAQINAARGNACTLLPPHLTHPDTWN